LRAGQDPGREGYLRGVTEDHVVFSDLRYVAEERLIDGDNVVSRKTITSAHDRREYHGVIPTGIES
jgi:predicted ester cyclase